MNLLEDVQEPVKADMTPMIDTVFLMIIFFVCIDFKVLESKLPAYLPKDRGSQGTLAEPQEQLSVRIYVETEGTKKYPDGATPGAVDEGSHRPLRFRVENHQVRWEVGPKPFRSLDDVKAELLRIARDPGSQVPDKQTGSRKLMSCVVEAYPGAYYDDVAKTADACHEAGFPEIHFGGGLGPRK